MPVPPSAPRTSAARPRRARTAAASASSSRNSPIASVSRLDGAPRREARQSEGPPEAQARPTRTAEGHPVSTKSGKPIACATAQDPGGFGLGLAQIYHPRLGSFWFYEGITLGYRGTFAWFPRDDLVLATTLNSQPHEDHVGALMETIYN